MKIYRTFTNLFKSARERSGFATREDITRLRDFISELTYQQIFLRKGYPIDLQPVSGAANYSFLYVIDRILHENNINNIIEFGSGQTTFLLDFLKQKNQFNFTTIEHDKFWLEEIAKKTSVKPVFCPVQEFTYKGKKTSFYDLKQIDNIGKFDLVIVDGPPGYQYDKFARVGILDFVKKHLCEDFILIFDDANRRGEHSTIREVKKYMKNANIIYSEKTIKGAKWQTLIFTNCFHRLNFY